MDDYYESGRYKGYWGALPPQDMSNDEAMRGYYDGVRAKKMQDASTAQQSSCSVNYAAPTVPSPTHGYLP